MGAKKRTECDKKFRVVAVVKVFYEVSKGREFGQNGDNFRGGNELQ